MRKQIFLLTACVILVTCQDENESEWYPFLRETQDNTTSPQLALKDRKKLVDENSPFAEHVPVGDFHLNDVVLSAEQRDQLFKPILGRSIIADKRLRWTDAIIPYEFDCSIEKLENAVAAVKAGMREWESKTCIRFKKRTNEKMYLRFIRDTHCWGHVGMHNYSTISVGYGCENQNVMSHEIGHAIGFHHEMNRVDRDSYVEIMWQNIGQFKSAFEKVKNTITVGVPYDYESIMHYPWSAFSSNGQQTMRPRRRTILQPYVKISAADAKETAIMYKCQGRQRMSEEISKQVSDEGLDSSIELFASGGCFDKSKKCKVWGEAEYCNIYSKVTKLCPITCKTARCSRDANCQDLSEHCAAWSKSNNNCKDNAYVKENCCKSCRGLSTVRPPPVVTPKKKIVNGKCDNKKVFCGFWRREGHCVSSKWMNFMQENCCKACKAPEPQSPPPPTTKPDGGKKCVNKKDTCDAWKGQGFCKPGNEWFDYMQEECCLACNGGQTTVRPTTTTTTTTTTLPPKPEECVDKEKKDSCVIWKGEGYCEEGGEWFDYMKDNCCQTCKGEPTVITPPPPITQPTTTTTTTKKPPVTCTNKNENCAYWKTQGFCKPDSSWYGFMEENCCLTCGGTGGKVTKPPTEPPTTTTTTTTTTTQKPDFKCADKSGDKCTYWKKQGFCKATSEHSEFMKENCCQSCKATPPVDCEDKDKSCAGWGQAGYCRDNAFVKENCCKTCGGKSKPKPTERPKPTETPTKKSSRTYLGTGVLCEDTRQDCPSLAARGECQRNAAWMNYYCKKSCRFGNCDQPGLKPSGKCASPLGLSYKSQNPVPDSAFKSARGYLSTGGWNAYPSLARLYQPDNMELKKIGGWCASTGKTSPSTQQSLSIDLQYTRRITHIATQGRDKYFERISEFKIEYSSDGYTFQPYKENGKERVFRGSCDYRTPVVNKFDNPINARHIKYIPWKWNYPCVRMELYGCIA